MPLSPELERGRRAFRQHAWSDAYEALAETDRAAPLGAEDLECLAMAAYLTGRDDEHAALLERAHLSHRARGDDAAAARCAFWIGFMQMFRGNAGHASGWMATARRLLGERECAEQGYLLLPAAEGQLRQDALEKATATASRAAEIGERFGDRDLTVAARHLHGRALLQEGRMDRGLALLDEVMVAVTTNELSPVMTGLLYCSVIDACQRAWAVDRTVEWTRALSHWCDAQPGLVAFTSACLVRRAEVMNMRGDWSAALREAQRACERAALHSDGRPPAAALYQLGEIYRLRGQFREAEAAYRAASAGGRDPQPGFALLRLGQRRPARAAQAIARAVAAAAGPLERSTLLPAQVEIALAVGDAERARQAAEELQDIAGAFDASALRAMAAGALGQVQLADGDASTALSSLREAWQVWTQLDAPWLAARIRVLIGRACRELGDDDGAALEFRAARDVFEQLGAAPDLERIDTLIDALDGSDASGAGHRLSPREQQVLRLVAAGKTNRAIAGQLGISEKTVARHMSNIFSKLGLSTRSAAAAWAWQNDMA